MPSLKNLLVSKFSNKKPAVSGEYYFRHKGFCPICERKVEFKSESAWFRDNFRCSRCKSIPRERALVQVLKSAYPNFKDLKIHESSPGGCGASQKLKRECKAYSFSFYFPNITLGESDPETGFRCENLEELTFPDNTFDLFVTQDVLEHVMNPLAAFQEIGRVLKPGGAHIFTAPLVNKFNSSERRASLLDSSEIHHQKEPLYHTNPINRAEGSLVTVDWGYDIASYIQEASGLNTIIMQIDDIDMGIRADLIEVVISSRAESEANRFS